MENNNESKTLNILVAKMALRKRRMEQSKEFKSLIPSPDALLSNEEMPLFNAIAAHYRQKIVDEALVSSAQADRLFADAIAPFGKKFVVEVVAREPLVYGIPYTYFVLNAAICLIAYLWATNFVVLLLIAPLMLGVQRFYYLRVRDERNHALTEKVLRGDIFSKSN
jgi:type IV secretory pathway VirB3-like protein